MLGTVARDHVLRAAELLAAGDSAALLDYTRALDEFSPDFAQLLEQLASLLERVALKQLVPGYEGDELHSVELLSRLAAQIAPEDLQLYYQTAILGRRDLVLAPDARTGFRMTLIRMLAFRPAQPGVPASSAASAAPIARARQPAASSAAETSAPPPTLSAVPSSGREQDWPAIVAALDLSAGAKQLASNCALLGREGALVRLALDPRSAMMRTNNLEEKLAQALSRYYGSQVRLEFESGEVTPDTPARAAERNEAQLRTQAQVAFEADPVVESFKQRFGASVLSDSVRSLKSNE
jgi:DNA polymerase-3 subunit gamma/tau